MTLPTNPIEGWIQIAKNSSDVNRAIMAYVQQNYERVAFMSSSELASSVGVSQASISRFANTLGFAGFGEWSKEMQRLIRMELSAADRLWFAVNPNLDTDDESGDRVVQSEYLHLQQIDEIVRSDGFDALANALIVARRVIFVSARASATLVPYVHYFLSKVRAEVYCAVPGDTLWERLMTENPADTLVVAIAFPRYPRVLIDLVKGLVEQGFHVAAITDDPNSPVAQLANPAVFVPVTTASLFDSYATPITMFNLLIRRIAQLTPDASQARLHKIENIDRQNGVYY